jgi:hypothetical protein
MITALVIVGALAASGITATVTAVLRDGYRAQPARRPAGLTAYARDSRDANASS